ncbi:MAG: hypothetical protein WCB68_07025 [Pyrinomonadaceae bacterium]
MAASYGYRSESEAELKAEDLRARYRHVEVVYAGEIIVWYCCPRDEFDAALERKLGCKCRKELPHFDAL